MKTAIDHPDNGVALVSSGIKEGIGICYEIANSTAFFREKIKPIGIMSESEKTRRNLWAVPEEDIVLVPSLQDSLRIPSKYKKYNYRLYPAEKYGELISMGGGVIANSDISFAAMRGITTTIYPHLPDRNKLQYGMAMGYSQEKLCPILYKFFIQEDACPSHREKNGIYFFTDR